MSTLTPTILLIESDLELGSMLKDSLELKNYRVDMESRGDRALQLFQAAKYDVILMDVVLAGISGLELAKTIRKTDYLTPILFISAKDDDREKIHAYCSGGDDYIVKPFTITELSLRIYALLKRAKPSLVSQELPDTLHFGNFTFNYPNRMLCTPSDTVPLTKKEAEVLRMLASNINNVVKREKVLTNVWGENDYFMGRSMDVYIARLRKKLAEDKNVSIVNVHRMGFKLEVATSAVPSGT
ncbi:MAG: response regulator transcription factor [Bacteroidales bacterium]|nr:response regulator transcription factor [Bacteroidales bacterium]